MSSHDEDNDSHIEKPQVSAESVQQIFEIEPEKVTGIKYVDDLRKDDDSRKKEWKEAVQSSKEFPSFDDGYGEDFYYDAKDKKLLEKLPDYDHYEEIDKREERRRDLRETYNYYKDEWENKAPRKDSDSDLSSDRSESTDESDEQQSDLDTNSSDDSEGDSYSNSDSEKELPEQKKKKTQLDHQLTYEEFKDIVILRSRLQYIIRKGFDLPQNLLFLIIVENKIGSVKLESFPQDKIEYRDITNGNSFQSTDVSDISDSEPSRKLYNQHKNLLTTHSLDISSIKTLIQKIKKLPIPPPSKLDDALRNMYELAIQDKIPIDSVLFNLNNKQKEYEAINDHDDASDSESSFSKLVDEVSQMIRELERKKEERAERSSQVDVPKNVAVDQVKQLEKDLVMRSRKVSSNTEKPETVSEQKVNEQISQLFSDSGSGSDSDSD